jgi:Spy/CpxP family protein refolding chaperone
MKRNHTALVVLFGLFLVASTVNAQGVTDDRTNRLREEERALNLAARRVPSPNPNGPLINGGAWWTNTTVVAQLALTEDQKAKIGRAFDSHSRTIVYNSGQLEKEEMQLARLLEAESVDHTAVLNQTNRVIQSRGEVERETAAMTLEMREQLTRVQWMKLQSMQTNQFRTAGAAVRQQEPASTATPAPAGQRSRGQ